MSTKGGSTTSLKVVQTGRFATVGLPSEKDASKTPCMGVYVKKDNNKTKTSTPTPPQQQQQQQQSKEKGSDKKKGGNNNQQQQQQQKKSKESNVQQPEREWTNELQKDYDNILSVGEECISPQELKKLLLMKGRGSSCNNTSGGGALGGFNLYDGFEPSGRMHIAQGVFKAMNVNKCTSNATGGTFVFWVADFFALMNDKMGGDLDKIKTVGYYLIEVWKAAGMDLTNVVFKWASEEITSKANQYWTLMLDVARRFTITRIKKCCQIMGRLEGNLTAAQILYPLMQCTDVFFLKADICQLGVDQRKVNMLAREYCDAAKIKHKPIILSHHMLYGLKAGQEKMSKSDPDSAIFMEDSIDDVKRKILKAYCPSKEEETETSKEQKSGTAANEQDDDDDDDDAGKASMHLTEDLLKNPCLDYIQHIILCPPNATYTANGVVYKEFNQVKEAFLSGNITEEQLKLGLIDSLNKLLEPVRQHFANNTEAKDLLEKVRQYKKETSGPAKENDTKVKKLFRLDLVKLKKVPANSHLVFVPIPMPSSSQPIPTLQTAIDLLTQLRAAPSADRPCVLYLLDWSARVCNSYDADVKAITANYTIILTAMKALDEKFMSDKVQIIWQSDAILMDPSNYWINVINVGRHFNLNQVMGNDGTLKDKDCVGIVIARLMKIADIVGIEPASISCLENSYTKLEATLVKEFIHAKLPGVTVPQINFTPSTPIQLQQQRESDAFKTDNDEYFLLDDPKVHGKAKVKKAFCEEGNITFCPPISLASAFVFDNGASSSSSSSSTLLIERSDENGGNKTYENVNDLKKDFESKALHPGDLKASITKIMVHVLDTLVKAIKQDKDALKASKDLKAYTKKMSKNKK